MMLPVRLEPVVGIGCLLLLVGCGGGAARSAASEPRSTVTVTATPTAVATMTRSATPTPTPTAKPESCADFLGPNSARSLAGGSVKAPSRTKVGTFSGCRWHRTDGSGILAAASLPAREWVIGLPAVIDTARSLLQETKKGRQAVALIERKLKTGSYGTNARGCELFRILVNAQYANIPKDSDLVVSYYPAEGKTQVVVGQACVNGRFWSLAWTETSGVVKDRDAVGERFEDALLKASLG